MIIAPALCLALLGCSGAAGALSLPTFPATVAVPHLVTLGDSITYGIGASDRARTSYPAIIAQTLGATLTNLGLEGETEIPLPSFLSPDGTKTLGPKRGLLADEVPKIPLDASIVTLFIGTNDEWLTANYQSPPVPNLSLAYATSIQATVSAIRARVPEARLILATVPNSAISRQGLSPAPQDLTIRRATATFARSMKAALVATGLPVVDLLCEPALYNPANFSSSSEVHPNDSGHAAIASDFVKVIRGPYAAPKPCAYETGP